MPPPVNETCRALLSDYKKCIPLLSEFMFINQIFVFLFIHIYFSLFCLLNDEECFPRCIKHVCCCWVGLFPFSFPNIVWIFCKLSYLLCHVLPQSLLQCCCCTVCFCDNAIFMHFYYYLRHYGAYFFKNTLVEVRMYKDTHLRSYFFSENEPLIVTHFTTVDWEESLQSHFPLLCYTANKCGAVNMQILYPYPMIWPHFFSHYVPVSFICH